MLSLLIITGTMGAGKTAVLGEASDILSARQIVHAAIDVDALGLAHLRGSASNVLVYENLRGMVRNYATAGVQRFLIARAIDNSAELKLCRDIIPATDTVVCRLVGDVETMKTRVERRELGMWQQKYVDRVATLNDVLDQAHLEDFAVRNEKSLTHVATEMLVKAGWVSP